MLQLLMYVYCSEHAEAVKVLTELRVWQEQAIAGGLPGWILSEIFRINLKVALLGGSVNGNSDES